MALPDDHEPVPKEFSGPTFGPNPDLDSVASRLNETILSLHAWPSWACAHVRTREDAQPLRC
jgi:hypothetical protein